MDSSSICSLCDSRLIDPRVITCGHSFCSSCLEKFLNNKNAQNTISKSNSNNPNEPFAKYVFKCPYSGCGKELTINELTIEQFPLKVSPSTNAQEKKQKEEKRNNNCAIHDKDCILFCKYCIKAICIDCIIDHNLPPHQAMSMSQAIEQFKKVSNEINEKIGVNCQKSQVRK